jgi:hypothetical protein
MCLLVKFVFDLYDTSGEGFLSKDEMGGLLRDVYGSNFNSSAQARSIMSKVPAKNLSFQEFLQFVTQHGGLLFQAFIFQSTLRKRFIGTSFWKKHAKRRKIIPETQIVYAMSFLTRNRQGKKIPGLISTVVPRRRNSSSIARGNSNDGQLRLILCSYFLLLFIVCDKA